MALLAACRCHANRHRVQEELAQGITAIFPAASDVVQTIFQSSFEECIAVPLGNFSSKLTEVEPARAYASRLSWQLLFP